MTPTRQHHQLLPTLIRAFHWIERWFVVLTILLAIAIALVALIQPGFVSPLIKLEKRSWNFRVLIAILLTLTVGARTFRDRVRAWWSSRQHEIVIEQRCYTWRSASDGDLGRIAQMGHDAYGSDAWADGLAGRERYIRDLYDGNRFTFWVVQYDAANGDGSRIVGYAAILPLRGEVYQQYVDGTVDQYQLKASDLVHPSERLGALDGLGLYVQAVYTDPDHRDRQASIHARFNMVCEQVVTLLECHPGERILIVAEEFDSDGKKLMSEYGFAPKGKRSPRGHMIWTFDSYSPQLTVLGNLFVREVKRPRHGL